MGVSIRVGQAEADDGEVAASWREMPFPLPFLLPCVGRESREGVGDSESSATSSPCFDPFVLAPVKVEDVGTAVALDALCFLCDLLFDEVVDEEMILSM